MATPDPLLPAGEKVPEGRMRGDVPRVTSGGVASRALRSLDIAVPPEISTRSSGADRFDGAAAAATRRPCLLFFQGLGHDR